MSSNNDGFLPLLYEEIIMSISASIAAESQLEKSVLATQSFDTLSASEIESITPYHVITLLLDGALSRIDEAMASLSDGEIDQANLLIQKTIGIVNGLRESLDLSQGGDIANNLDTLYEYILHRLNDVDVSTPINTLTEVKNLLQEVHEGWVGISDNVVEQ